MSAGKGLIGIGLRVDTKILWRRTTAEIDTAFRIVSRQGLDQRFPKRRSPVTLKGQNSAENLESEALPDMSLLHKAWGGWSMLAADASDFLLGIGEALMSWRPSNDPVLGDARSCEALELVIVPRARDLGGFEVRRALPHGKRQMVGPFIFFDHFGPVQFIAGQGMDVRPHPHIGLATVTYLFDGSIMHRDSEGNVQEIRPGAMNLMTAGRGIAHSERTPEVTRKTHSSMLGLQSWIALPLGQEDTAPSFQHFDADNLPVIAADGIKARIIAGSAFGKRAPVGMLSDWFYVEAALDRGATAPLDPDHEERAIYVVDGEIEIAGDRFEGPRLLVFRPGDRITIKATRQSRVMFLGGASMEGPRYIWWNFVSSRKERIEQAKEDWKSGRFDPVPDETEFISLPEH